MRDKDERTTATARSLQKSHHSADLRQFVLLWNMVLMEDDEQWHPLKTWT